MTASDGHSRDADASESPRTSSRPPRRLSAKRKWLFRGILVLFFLTGAEVSSYILLTLLDRWYPMDPVAKLTQEKVDGYLDGYFDGRLGWINRPGQSDGEINTLGARSTGEYNDLHDAVAAYGDSYTFCSGVPVADAWPTLLEGRIGRPVLNFGVGGYGTDQALLRLELTQPVTPASTILFCIQPENINRVVCAVRAFYQTDFGPPKPFFTLNHDHLELHNPFTTPQETRRLLLQDHDRLFDIIRDHDRWYAETEFMGRPWSIRFPYSIEFAVRVPYLWRRLGVGLTDIPIHARLYRENGDAFGIMKALIRRFDAFTRERGVTGLVIILPPPRDVARFTSSNENNYQPLIDFLESQHLTYHDMLAALAKQADMDSLYVSKSGHYSRKGNEIIAAELDALLKSLPPRPPTSTPTGP